MILLAIGTNIYQSSKKTSELYEQASNIATLETRLMNETKKRIEFKKQKHIPATITAYAPFDNQSGICADNNPNSTSIGLTPGEHIAAVDPQVIPYGTKFVIEGMDIVFTAGDTGQALKDDKKTQEIEVNIDIFKQTYKEAIEFGKQQRYIIILD